MEESKANPKVSVIVPVYRAEKYVSKCIDSILNQTYPNWELILVDDGSPDNSGSICDQYAAKDNRIRVFHKENGGVSSARNYGLDYSQGDWLTFVDSDDLLVPEALEVCSSCFKEYSIIRFSLKYILSEDEQVTRDYNLLDSCSKDDYLSRIVSRETLLGVCGGIYRSSLFADGHIRFDHSLIDGEDWLALCQLISLSDAVKIINEPLYLYRRTNENSITQSVSFESIESIVKALIKITDFCECHCKPIDQSFFTKAKYDIGYLFTSGLLLKSFSATKNQIDSFYRDLDLPLKSVVHGNLPVKRKIVLCLLCSSIGRFFLNLR